jgi:hypothetical protein
MMTAQLTRTLENDDMPKVLILFAGDDGAAAPLAKDVGAAAKAVRFTEVDIRAVADQTAEGLQDYDGVVIVGSGDELPPSLAALLDACERSGAPGFENTVLASVGFANAAILERVARLGGIVVTGRRRGLDSRAHAVLVGTRAAKVAGWVRHALSHEHAHHHHAH